MKAESIVLVVCTVCMFFAFYFAFISFQLEDYSLKKQSVNFAVYSFIFGVMLLFCFMVYLGIKKALLRSIENPKLESAKS